METCVLCKDKLTPLEFDSGVAINAVNPLTFRKANMHNYCLEWAIEKCNDLEPTNSKEFKNRADEYHTKHV